MNNDNIIKLTNENGVEREYGRIPDLWHIAMQFERRGKSSEATEILRVWHMAHDLKAVVEKQGQASMEGVAIQ